MIIGEDQNVNALVKAETLSVLHQKKTSSIYLSI